MADISTCPGCATPVRVPEGMAGKRAKCPNCQITFTIPAPEPAAAAADSPPVVELFKGPDSEIASPPRSKKTFDDEDDRPKRRERDWGDDEARPRAARQRKSSGSALPWVLGIAGVALLLIVFCGGGVVVIAIIGLRDRPPAPGPVAGNKDVIAKPPGGLPPPVPGPVPGGPGGPPLPGGPPVGPGPVGPGGPNPQINKLATRLQLVNGQTTVNASLNLQDPVDPQAQNCRCKLYQIDLQGNRTYTIEMATANQAQLLPFLRVEDLKAGDLGTDGGPAKTLARIVFLPPTTGSYIIYASSLSANELGSFTLTVREGPRIGP